MFLTIFLSWGQQLFLPPGHFVNLYMMIGGTEEDMIECENLDNFSVVSNNILFWRPRSITWESDLNPEAFHCQYLINFLGLLIERQAITLTGNN